ncbi:MULTISPECIES: flagellar hook-basal body complex protein [Clostridium]|uniref:Flagellar hook protein FlgE n=1 Tax=Clostridium lapidicellarium TaxID=3240931 RepID=A0ABV4DUZ2_9CLOT
MLPSLYSGISGLKANQQKLNVVANNIANSTTTGFKTQSMNFEDTLSQNLSDPSAPAANTGGVNGKQSGLGVKIGGINADFSEGSPQTTNRNLDFMIDKAGDYFVVKSGTQEYYTRDGSFVLDNQGNLLTTDGLYVQKTGGDKITIPVDGTVESFSVGQDGTITIKKTGGTVDDTQKIRLATFQNEGGLKKMGNNLYSMSSNSGNPIYSDTNPAIFGNIIQGSLEMSNVDLAQQFTDMIVASRAFEANGKIITTDDEILQDLVNLKR